MKAVVFDRYGPVDQLRLQDVTDPVPNSEQVRVAVRAASINPLDWHFLTGLPVIGRPMMGGVLRPATRRLGADLAGVVDAVGTAVTRFAPGDEVFGMVDGGVENQRLALGSSAEYVCVSQQWLERKPSRLTFEEAAAVPVAAITALQGLRDVAGLRAGQQLLVNGGSGGVGTFAVQLGKYFGAEVSGVCSTANVELVRSLGADSVVDYMREDFASGDRRYDVVLDNVGNRRLSDCRRVLRAGGTYVASFGEPEHRWLGPFAAMARIAVLDRFTGQHLVMLNQTRKVDDLGFLAGLLDAGTLVVVIDRTYPLAEVRDAMLYLERGHARGKVVLTV